MCKNPYTWNDDVKAVYAAMREIEESDAFGPSVMVNIEQKVISPLRERCSRAEQALADARTEIERLKAQRITIPEGYDFSDLGEAQDTIDRLEAENATLRARCERLEAPVTGDELREQGFETVGADDRYLRMAFDEITRARAAAQTQKGEADANNDV